MKELLLFVPLVFAAIAVLKEFKEILRTKTTKNLYLPLILWSSINCTASFFVYFIDESHISKMILLVFEPFFILEALAILFLSMVYNKEQPHLLVIGIVFVIIETVLCLSYFDAYMAINGWCYPFMIYLTVAMKVPQITKIVRNNDYTGISASAYGLLAIDNLLLIGYYVWLGENSIVLSFLMCFVSNGIIYLLKYRKFREFFRKRQSSN